MNNPEIINDKKTKKIAIFASGSGTNAENIIKYFFERGASHIFTIYTNKSDASVIERANKLEIPVIVFNKDDFYQNSKILNLLIEKETDLIILAGFLWLIPENITKSYDRKIINIHPALLPDFGGKGMYGDNVHKKVIESGNTKSGISIHYVNEKYDDGNIIFQATCEINKNDDYLSLAKKIHELEYKHYPKVIEELIKTS